MAIYLGATQLDSGGSGGGGGLSETQIFTSSGTWTVPDKVKDEIASEGHAEIGLLMVGGGSIQTTASDVATRSGEVIQEYYQLTTNDYDDATASTPEITVVVGAAGGFTGITEIGDANVPSSIDDVTQSNSFSDTNSGSGTTLTLSSTTQTVANNQYMLQNGSYKPAVTRVRITNWTNSVGTYSAGPTGLIISTSGGTVLSNTGTYGDKDIQWEDDDPAYLDYIRFQWQRYQSYVRVTATWNGTGWTWSRSGGDANFNAASASFGFAVDYVPTGGITSAKKARAGLDPEYTQFLNNPYSRDGYAGGYSKNTQHGTPLYVSESPGSPGEGGYVQIFF